MGYRALRPASVIGIPASMATKMIFSMFPSRSASPYAPVNSCKAVLRKVLRGLTDDLDRLAPRLRGLELGLRSAPRYGRSEALFEP